MDIIKEFQKYPKAWDAFLEWYKKQNEDNFWAIYYHRILKQAHGELTVFDIRYMLADMQAWLDSVGMYCDAFWVVDKFFAYADKKNVEMWQSKNGFPTRPEALIAAVLKGCEIFENSKTQ